MIKPTDAVRLHQRRSRREALRLLGAGAATLAAAPHASFAQSSEETVLTEALVLRDPDIPVAGNANGDITIVEYFDYNVRIAARSSLSWGRWCTMMATLGWCRRTGRFSDRYR